MQRLRQFAERTTVHHDDQRLARIVKRRQTRTVHGLQFDVEIWSEPVSLVQRHPAVPSGDGKIPRRMGFKISINKAVERLFSRSKHIPTDEILLKINDVTIKFIEKTVKFLGVIFDHGLIWAADIDNIIDRCTSCARSMNRLRERPEASCLSSTRFSSGPSSTTDAWPTTVRQR